MRMSRFSRIKPSTAGNVKAMYGRIIPRPLAKFVCVCADCLGPVDKWNATVRCVAHPEAHTHLLHKDDAALEQARREAELADVEAVYIIDVDHLVALDDHTKGTE